MPVPRCTMRGRLAASAADPDAAPRRARRRNTTARRKDSRDATACCPCPTQARGARTASAPHRERPFIL
jgi:hypothetical protein